MTRAEITSSECPRRNEGWKKLERGAAATALDTPRNVHAIQALERIGTDPAFQVNGLIFESRTCERKSELRCLALVRSWFSSPSRQASHCHSLWPGPAAIAASARAL